MPGILIELQVTAGLGGGDGMSGRVVVVGGGIAGLCCAYYLRRRDFDVTIVESNRVGSGASFANGGWLCPAQAGPLPAPGLTLYGMRALFDRDSALYFKPGEWSRLTPWLLRFWTYCNEHDYAQGTAAIAQLGHDVFDLIEEMQATASSSSCTSRAWSTPRAAPRTRAPSCAASRRCASTATTCPTT